MEHQKNAGTGRCHRYDDFLTDRKFFRGRGCASCNNTGYKGRVGLFEFMPITDEIREIINRGGSTAQIRDAAMRTGMHPLRDSGLEKVYSGVTTIEEVIRETVADA